MKKVINARILVKADAIETFLEASRTMLKESHLEPGCLVYNLYQEVDRPTSFIFYEVYENQEALNTHNSSHYLKTFKEKISEILTEQPQLDVF